ncbi:helicase/relaxase domain-containing protein, partial [Gallibacterium sp. AGMB14963]|uniref:helicase/relaxase domain-containing protein n=1 Tax=Gallibacterium faecale TaxID=3019086 RepID=UPI0022F15145
TKLKQPQKSFANQILTALRYLIEHDLQLNNEKSGSDGWLTDEGLWLVSKTVTDKIRAYLMQQGISVPAQNSKLFDEMQAHRIIESTPDNKAIWNAQIKSNAGWQPQISFTLLKVSPSLIWDSIDKRPAVFNGIVIVNNQSEQKNTDDDNSGTDVNNIIPIDTQEKKFNDSFDFALNLFNTPDNTEQKQDEQKQENSITNELVHATEKISTLSDTITLLTDNTDQINTEINAEINAEKFVEWLKTSLANDTFPINEPQAKIHFVNDCIFLVTPGIFQVYCQTTAGNTNSWRELQKQFQRLNLHKKKQPGNFNIWTCIIKGNYKTSRVKGYLIENIEFFTNKQYFNNMYLTLQDVSNDEE